MERLARRVAPLAWIALLAVAATELLTHVTVRSRVASERDWRAAAAFVREQWQEGDLALAAPAWADPLLRRHLGDVLRLRDVARSDLAGYRRLWSLSQRGYRPAEADDGPPELRRQFGRLLVERWRLATPRLLFDFVAHVERARVARLDDHRERVCSWRRTPPSGTGGLGRGPYRPEHHAVCPGGIWVGATVVEDLSLRLRRCVLQPPPGAPLTVTFEDVPLEGGQLVAYAGLYHRDERKREGPPITLRVLLDGREIARMVHRDGEGWKRMVSEPLPEAGRGTFRFVVEGKRPRRGARRFCWAASVQRAPKGAAR